MKGIIRVFLIVFFPLVLNACVWAEDDMVSAETKQHEAVILDELKRLNIETVGEHEHISIILPEDLMAGASWGVKTPICRAGGYDVDRYAGLEVDLAVFDIVEPNSKTKKMKVYVATRADTIVCVYKTIPGMMPGVYPATKNFENSGDRGLSGLQNKDLEEATMDDFIEPQQGAMISCEYCVHLYPDDFKERPETCPICHGAKEHFQEARMMSREMAREEAKKFNDDIKQMYVTPSSDDPDAESFSLNYREIRKLHHRRLIHALIYDRSKVKSIVKRIHELDKYVGTPIKIE